MSRARNIKPGFFKNDRLAECEPLARLLFAGLWCEADRDGRLEDRPKRLKVECLPYDDCDVERLLKQLQQRGFIVRYSVNENSYIQVVAFSKHQNPHVKEVASSIPAPDEHSASTVQVPEKNGTSPADSLLLIPDSPSPKKAYAPPAALLIGVSEELVSDFNSLRKAKRQPLTASAVKGITREGAKAGLTLEETVRVCCERGWAGFKAEWYVIPRVGGQAPAGKVATGITKLEAMKNGRQQPDSGTHAAADVPRIGRSAGE